MGRKIDIRETEDEQITVIRFGDPDEVEELADYIMLNVNGDIEIRITGCANRINVYSEDVDNLIKALQKSKELGWY